MALTTDLALRLSIAAAAAALVAAFALTDHFDENNTLGGALLLFGPAALAFLALLPSPRPTRYAIVAAAAALAVGVVVAVHNARGNNDSADAVVFTGTLVFVTIAASLVALFVWRVLRIVIPRRVGRQ